MRAPYLYFNLQQLDTKATYEASLASCRPLCSLATRSELILNALTNTFVPRTKSSCRHRVVHSHPPKSSRPTLTLSLVEPLNANRAENNEEGDYNIIIATRSSAPAYAILFPLSSQVTTTDGEQPDDSFDLIDVPAEMSPPATAPSQPSLHTGHRHSDETAASRSSSPVSPTSPISVATSANRQTPPPLAPSSPSSPLCAFDGIEARSSTTTRCSRLRLDSTQPDSNSKVMTGSSSTAHGASNGTEGAVVPPPTPMVGSHSQETRFTFGSGRTPPLPDLRAADFFR